MRMRLPPFPYALALAALFLSGCYNRYRAPLFWRNLPYPYIQTGLVRLPCAVDRTLAVEVADARAENAGKPVGDTPFRSELVLDNELSDVQSFLVRRFCTYFEPLRAGCVLAPDSGRASGTLRITVKTITPDIRGAFWMRARGIVDLTAALTRGTDTLFAREFIAIAQDGDPDVPIGKFGAVSYELGGKLVTATSLKRIADSLAIQICRVRDRLGAPAANAI